MSNVDRSVSHDVKVENDKKLKDAEHANNALDRAQSKKAGKSQSAFRTISEVAQELDVQQHVLRFWETKFSQVKPLKRGGGRRYYRPEDIAVLKAVHHLLYVEGYTIKGVQKLLRELGKKKIAQRFSENTQVEHDLIQNKSVPETEPSIPASVARDDGKDKKKASVLSSSQRVALQELLSDLKNLRANLK